MKFIFLRLFFCVMVLQPFAAMATPLGENPSQVVAAFQKLPHSEMFCEDETWGDYEPVNVGAKFEKFFSKDFYKLFLWSQCRQPRIPPGYRVNAPILFEIRFAFPLVGLGGNKTILAEHIRVSKPILQGPDKATVKILYDFGTLKNLVTTYTLIREDGQWKIDDIAPQGDFEKDNDGYEPSLDHSDSIKADMQKNYNAAEARYKQEQAKKQ